jgi:hypothetical protein
MRARTMGVIAAMAMLMASGLRARGSPVIEILGDTGNLEDTFFATSITSGEEYANPYGTGGIIPRIAQIDGGWKLTFAPSADFLAIADNMAGGERQVFDGNLSFTIDFGVPIHLVTLLSEDGLYGVTGNGAVTVKGGVIVVENNGANPAETLARALPVPTFGPADGYWSVKGFEISGFKSAYSSYHVSLDNILKAWSLSSETAGSAWIAKKNFSLIFLDGGDPTPEPATLGVLATGCLALLARRRRT